MCKLQEGDGEVKGRRCRGRMGARARARKKWKEISTFPSKCWGAGKGLKGHLVQFSLKEPLSFINVPSPSDLLLPMTGCLCSSQSSSFNFQTTLITRGFFLTFVKISVLGAYFRFLVLVLLPSWPPKLYRKCLQHDCLKYLEIVSMNSLSVSFSSPNITKPVTCSSDMIIWETSSILVTCLWIHVRYPMPFLKFGMK